MPLCIHSLATKIDFAKAKVLAYYSNAMETFSTTHKQYGYLNQELHRSRITYFSFRGSNDCAEHFEAHFEQL